MRYSPSRIIILILFGVIFNPAIFAQDNQRNRSDQEVDEILENILLRLQQPAVDINRTPINICFIKNGGSYAGFVIAGHASKDVCGVATLRVTNLLDSMGYAENTIFSFGVGYDRMGSRNRLMYDKKLRSLEHAFKELEKEYYCEVRVQSVQDSVFTALSTQIKENTRMAFNTLMIKPSLNRVIFRYDSISFPIPVPFYTENGTVRFNIPKSSIGRIPGARVYNASVIENALKEINSALAANVRALHRLALYEPVIRASRTISHYPITYFGSGRIRTDTLLQVDLSKVLEIYEQLTGRTIRYYSLSELRTKCNAGVKFLDEKKAGGSKISPCEQVAIAEDFLKRLEDEKHAFIRIINKTNTFLENEKNKIVQFRSEFLRHPPAAQDSLMLVDALLRGWNFNGGSTEANRQLQTWYNKRPGIWKSVLTRNPAYSKRVSIKKDAMPIANQISGVFHWDDVFFSVRESGSDYLVTPYKMLSGKLVQVIDRKSGISQFVSENNFRILKL